MDLAAVTICAITGAVMPDPTPISPDQVERLVGLLRAMKSNLADILEAVAANTIAEMTSKQAVHVMSLLQQERALRDKSPGL